MRFMILVKATIDSEAGRFPPEPQKQQLFANMATFHEALQQAGALVDASGLKPSSAGWRIHYHDGSAAVVDGPFTETKELIAGYTIIRVNSRAEALEWSRRFPNPVGEGQSAQIEVRQLYELEDFADIDAIERFRQLEAQ